MSAPESNSISARQSQQDEEPLRSLGLSQNPLITGLWQVADLERDGVTLDRASAADALLHYVAGGFTCFDMADHYGSAELIAGAARNKLAADQAAQLSALRLYTKWCPKPNQYDLDAVKKGVGERMERLGVDSIDLLQLHWWSFEHPGYIDVMDGLMRLKQDGWIKHIGLTNFDTDHLHLLLANDYEIATNQVCLSILDQRALRDMTDLCHASGVRLLTYGSLAGGFLSEKWLAQPEPRRVDDWSKMKYLRFIHATGGWDVFQRVLQTLGEIATKHNVSVANVAARWALQQSAVAGVIIGARITENNHLKSNLNLMRFSLDEEDLQQINSSASHLRSIRGDCGSEYRQAPFLTASGDLSDHLEALPQVYTKESVPGRSNRWRLNTGSEFEPVCGYSRAVREGNRVWVSGTTATHARDRAIGADDVRAQAVYILDKIAASLSSLGASLQDVTRTRIYMADCSEWEAVSRVHGRYFADCLPANTLIEVSRLVGPYTLEIEAEAVIEI